MKRVFFVLFILTLAIHISAQTYEYKTKEWKNAGKILSRIKVPVFPARDFKITDFGAVEGGKQDCTEAIRKAI